MSGKELLLPKDKNQRTGLAGSLIFHLVLIVLLIIPFVQFHLPPPDDEGILVSLGLPDQGDGDDLPQMQDQEMVEPRPLAQTTPKVVATPVVQKSEPPAAKQVITSEDPDVIAVRKEKEAETRRVQEENRKRQQAEAAERAEAEQQARLKADADARKKAEYDQSKKQYGSLLNGTGKGQTGTPGNQGSPNGDPRATNLVGVSTGSGMVGGGLGNRGVKFEPAISDDSQKVGKVVVNVCVDKSGRVVSAEYTQKGSTTTDSDLRALAERSAKKFIFTESGIEKQCGTITVDFKVR